MDDADLDCVETYERAEAALQAVEATLEAEAAQIRAEIAAMKKETARLQRGSKQFEIAIYVFCLVCIATTAYLLATKL